LLVRGPALSQTESGQHHQNDRCPQSVWKSFSHFSAIMR
jgi:hypothetical protein